MNSSSDFTFPQIILESSKHFWTQVFFLGLLLELALAESLLPLCARGRMKNSSYCSSLN